MTSTFSLMEAALERLHARIAELEAANAICRTDIEALMTSCDRLEARNTELEAENARLKARDSLGPYKLIHPDHLAGLDARIAELEAEVERIAADDLRKLQLVVSQRDTLRLRIAELEAALDSMTIERGTAQAERDEILHDKHDRIAGLEAEIARLVDLTPFTTIADLEARNAVCRRDIEALMRSADSLEARNTELEAERDRLKENLAEEREACAQDAIDYAGIGWRSGAREGIAALIRARAALSDPSGE